MIISNDQLEILKAVERVFSLSEGDFPCCQKDFSKEDLCAVPPRNCPHTVIPLEKKETEDTYVSVFTK